MDEHRAQAALGPERTAEKSRSSLRPPRHLITPPRIARACNRRRLVPALAHSIEGHWIFQGPHGRQQVSSRMGGGETYQLQAWHTCMHAGLVCGTMHKHRPTVVETWWERS